MAVWINQFNVLPYDKRAVGGVSADLAVFSPDRIVDARFLLAVPALSGTTPFLDVRIETKTLAGNYVTLASFPRITEAGGYCLVVERLPKSCRISWDIGGTRPEFHFELDIVAHSSS